MNDTSMHNKVFMLISAQKKMGFITKNKRLQAVIRISFTHTLLLKSKGFFFACHFVATTTQFFFFLEVIYVIYHFKAYEETISDMTELSALEFFYFPKLCAKNSSTKQCSFLF